MGTITKTKWSKISLVEFRMYFKTPFIVWEAGISPGWTLADKKTYLFLNVKGLIYLLI